MKALLYYNTTTEAVTDGTSTWKPKKLTFGGALTIGLRFQADIGGTTSEISADVRYLKAAIGNVDLRPGRETFCIKVGDAPQGETNTTAPLPWNSGAQEIAGAINALATAGQYGQVTAKNVDGSTILKFGAGAADVALAVVNNRMEPASIGVVTAWQVAGEWFQELRLIQTPVAFTDSSERVLPPAPVVREVQAGGGDGTYTWNEIQQMEMPPDFRGTYQFKWKNVRTALLSRGQVSDGPDEITAALAIYGDKITATNPRGQVSRFEFGGNDFKGNAQPLLEVIVVDSPEGDLTFTLALDKPPLAALLRTKAEVTLPLEIEIGIGDNSQPTGIRKDKIRAEVTIQRGMIYDMLAAAAGIDWLRPIPFDYVPFTRDQILVGQLFWAGPIGDGEATIITVDHNLDTDAIAGVLLRENFADGRVLVLGADYTVTNEGRNSLKITILGAAPTVDGLGLVITAAGMRAVFQAHTHTIEQIVGLPDVLENVSQRLETLEAYLPTTKPTANASSTTGLTITIPATAEVLFYNAPTLDLKALPVRAPFLLPAVHAAAAIELPTPLPAPTLNGVWSAASRTLIPGTARITASYADAAGHVASDGRMLYPANQAAGTTSYYPAPFERTLFEFPINDAQLQVGRTLDVQFGVAAQLLHATCEAQWVAVIEWGIPTDQSAPANEGPNLETIAWSPTPLLAQRIYLTPLLMLHSFGCRIKRNADGLTADAMRYGGWQTAADAAPTSANFVLRARLIKFDTKNNVPNADGWLYYAIGSAIDSKTDAIATIA